MLYFRCWQLGRRRVGSGLQTSFQRPTSPSGNQWGKSFYRQKWNGGGGLRAKIAVSSLTVIFKLVISGLTSVILVVLDIVNFQFQGPFVPISLQQFSNLWQLMWWIQSSHHVVNFSTWRSSLYKRAHRIWLRILSVALEKEQKILDCA